MKIYVFAFIIFLFAQCSNEKDRVKEFVEMEIKKSNYEEGFALRQDSIFSKEWITRILKRELKATKNLFLEDAKDKVRYDSLLYSESDDSNYVERFNNLEASKKKYKDLLDGKFQDERIDRLNLLLQDPPEYSKYIYTPADSMKRKKIIWIARVSKIKPGDAKYITNSDTSLISINEIYYHNIRGVVFDVEF
jgi:hypothetical protein